MKQKVLYNSYPKKINMLAIVLQLIIYVIGVFFIYNIAQFGVIFYIIFIGILEIRLLKTGCIHCYYFDKNCAFGKGKIAAMIFKKGDSKKFIKKQITWKDILPDFLVSLIPLVIGLWILLQQFNWLFLGLLFLLIILAFPVTGYFRGSIACRNCKQRELGCPAEQLFNKNKITQR